MIPINRPAPTRSVALGPLLLLAVALGCLFSATLSASAHASLVSGTPADGSVIQEAPQQFKLTFSEPVSPLVLSLVRPDGLSTALDRFALRDRTLEIEAPHDLGEGTHVLSWRIVSEDGHPVGGAVIFSIGAPSAAPPIVADEIDWPVRAAIWSAKIALYLSLFLGIGGVFAGIWLTGSDRLGLKSALGFTVLGLAAVPLSLGLQGLDALGAPLSTITHIPVWLAGLNTSFGRTAIVAALSLGMALIATASAGTIARLTSAVALLGVGVALAASGHASAAEPQWLTRPLVFIHGSGIAFWAGALIPLAIALRRNTLRSAQMLQQFSKAIPYVVAVLVLSGAGLSIILVGTPSALLDTAYGNVLLVKLALLAGLFALACINRWILTGPAEHGDPSARRRLVRSIAAETAIVIVIFAVAAAWRFTPPPRVLAIAAAQPAALHIQTAKAMADLTISPGRAGPVRASIVVMSGEFGPLDAKAVTLVLSNPAAGIEQIKRSADKPGDGSWRVNDLIIPVAGNWTVRIEILVSDFEMARLEGKLEIRP